MKKIVLIGSGGSGKSTLARQLGEKLKIDVLHLDSLFWKPGWVETPREEWIDTQQYLVKREAWIMDGNYGRTMDIRLNAADTIIFLDMPRTICAYRAFKRMLQYRNKTRPDMAEGCEERFNYEFFKWIWEYPKTKRPKILERLEELSKEKEVIILKAPKEVENFLEQM
ncbi:DNA topology modulation protein [Mesobacillus foraminis]|uniref:DNA topology modulation protein n=1 Tax=Mesobacillus foraminis TaxID=279826 RepID=UPI0039A0EED3